MISKFLSLTVLVITMGYADGALAHAKLRSSIPADHAVLVETPHSITLTFNEAAQLAKLVLITDGHELPIKLDVGAKASRTITVSLPTLTPGLYTVTWSALSPADGHVMKGSLVFTLSAAK